jgi:hypothetical protein
MQPNLSKPKLGSLTIRLIHVLYYRFYGHVRCAFHLMVAVYFRRDGKFFNLVSVSGALRGSNFPNYFARVGKSRALEVNGDHRVLQKSEDGMDVSQIINDPVEQTEGVSQSVV